MVEPTDLHKRILSLIYSEFQRAGRQPTYQWIDKLADRDGISLRSVVSTMPPKLMTPDPGWSSGHYWRKEDELLVTVQGLLYCGDEARSDLDLLARVLRYFADRERAFTPTEPHVAEEIVITSEQVKADIGLQDIEVSKAYVLLQQFEAGMRFGSGHSDDSWNWTLDGEQIRKYRGVSESVSYLRARGDLPEPEPTDFLGRAKRQAQRSWLAVRGAGLRLRQRGPERLGAFSRHPLVIALVSATASAVVTLYLTGR